MIRHNGITICRETRTITHRERVQVFNASPIAGREVSILFDMFQHLILDEGISKAQLFWRIYGHDPEGGPLQGPHIFDVIMAKHRHTMFGLDLDLRSVKIAGVTFYSLIPVFRIVPMSQISRQINKTRKNNIERRAMR